MSWVGWAILAVVLVALVNGTVLATGWRRARGKDPDRAARIAAQARGPAARALAWEGWWAAVTLSDYSEARVHLERLAFDEWWRGR